MGRSVAKRKREADPAEIGPERTCAVTRQAGPPEAMLRFVLDPDGVVTPDIARKLPGRGVWILTARRHVADAARKGVFARAFKAPARAPDGLPELIDTLLERDALQSLSLLQKAGVVVVGAAKVEEALAADLPAGLIQASDGSADGQRKIEAALRRNHPDSYAAIPRVNLFSSSQLDLALGRLNVIHAALKRGPAAESFLTRCRRLADFRSDATTSGEPLHGAGKSGQPSLDDEPALPPADGASAVTNGSSGPQGQQ